MKKAKLALIIACMAFFTPWQSFAAKADKEQPIEVEADSLEIRDNENISIYSGNVRLIQGSLNVQADRLVIYFDDNKDLELMEMTGSPASFRQLNDDNKEMVGQADKLDYFEPKSLLVLTGNARFSSNGDVIESSTISINTETDNLEAASPEPDKRVRVVIQPKEKKQE
jgi:lipopolysaccharide export system protein LptA